MGKHAQAAKAAFFAANPFCIFCGGSVQATTKEHCPPRALFQNRHAPEGYIFASCESCNHGTSDDDLLISVLGRMNPFDDEHNVDGKLLGLFRNANNQHQGLARDMLSMSAIEARKAAKELKITPPVGLTYQQSGIVNITEHMHRSVRVFAKKLSKAVYYKETGNIFPSDGEVQFLWFSNADFFRYGSFPALDAFAELNAPKPKLVMNRQDLSNQFDYRFSLSTDGKLAVLRAVFGKAFGFLTILSVEPGVLAVIDAKLQAINEIEDSPFQFI